MIQFTAVFFKYQRNYFISLYITKLPARPAVVRQLRQLRSLMRYSNEAARTKKEPKLSTFLPRSRESEQDRQPCQASQ